MATRETAAKHMESTDAVAPTAEGEKAIPPAPTDSGDSSLNLTSPDHASFPVEPVDQKVSGPESDAVSRQGAPGDAGAVYVGRVPSPRRMGSQRLAVPSVNDNLPTTTGDGVDMPSSVVSTGSSEGLVIRRARVRAQRPLTYSVAPAAINITQLRSRAGSVAPSAAASPRIQSHDLSAPSDSLSQSVPGGATERAAGELPTDVPGNTSAAAAPISPSATPKVQTSRPAASQQMASQFALANAAMDRRLASRRQSRQASHIASRRLSPRGSVLRGLSGSADPIQKNLDQASAALLQHAEVCGRAGASEPEKRVFEDVGTSAGKTQEEELFRPQKLLSKGRSLELHRHEALVFREGSSPNVVVARQPEEATVINEPSGLGALQGDGLAADRGEENTGVAAGDMLSSLRGHQAESGRDSEGKSRLGAKHTTEVQDGVAHMVRAEEKQRAARITSRITSRAISRNVACKPPSYLRERTDVTHAAAEELRRRLAAEAINTGDGSSQKADNIEVTAERVTQLKREEDVPRAGQPAALLDQKARCIQAAWRGYRARVWFHSTRITAVFERQLRHTFGSLNAFGWNDEHFDDDRLLT